MKIDGDYLYVETFQESACLSGFVDKSGNFHAGYSRYFSRIHVYDAITPSFGDAIFWWFEMEGEDFSLPPEYDEKWVAAESRKAVFIKANALTIGKTVGELRSLLEWVKS